MNSKPAVQAPAIPAMADESGLVRNVMDQATANLIARVNAVSVTVEECSRRCRDSETATRNLQPGGANSLS